MKVHRKADSMGKLKKKKHFVVFLISLFVFTSCGNKDINKATISETVSESTVISVTTSITESEIVLEISTDMDKTAHIYTKSLMKKLENDKDFGAVGKEPDDIIGMRGFNSVLYLIDIDFDGTPELFAGRVGTIGWGLYEVFKEDGSSMGNVYCSSMPESGVKANGYIYVFSGRNPYPGWVKLVSGFPSIHIMGFADFEGSGNDVQILDGSSEKILEGLTFEEYKALYPEYLGVDYDVLTEHNETSDYIFAEGYLRVPDPENYTEEDIYNCLAELLSEYEKILMFQEK